MFLFHPYHADPDKFILANGYDIERYSPAAGADARIKILAHLPDIPRSMAEDASGNIWVGTFSQGVFLVPRDSDNSKAPIRIETQDGSPSTGLGGAALVNNLIAVFTNMGVELFAAQSKPGVPASSAPRTLRHRNLQPRFTGSVWVAFESPFSDGPRVPVFGRLSVDAGGNPSWKPYRCPD